LALQKEIAKPVGKPKKDKPQPEKAA